VTALIAALMHNVYCSHVNVWASGMSSKLEICCPAVAKHYCKAAPTAVISVPIHSSFMKTVSPTIYARIEVSLYFCNAVAWDMEFHVHGRISSCIRNIT